MSSATVVSTSCITQGHHVLECYYKKGVFYCDRCSGINKTKYVEPLVEWTRCAHDLVYWGFDGSVNVFMCTKCHMYSSNDDRFSEYCEWVRLRAFLAGVHKNPESPLSALRGFKHIIDYIHLINVPNIIRNQYPEKELH